MIRTDIGRTDKNGNAAWLAPAAAASLRRVDAALGFILAIVWAGRTRAEQLVLWLKYGKDPTKAAAPGTSLHEEGMSIDVPLRFVTAKFVALMLARGWKQTVKGEPWHFTYATSRDKHLNDPAPATAGGSTAPTPEEETPVTIFKSAKDPRIIIDELGADDIGDYKPTEKVSNDDLINATSAVYGEHQVIGQRELDVAKAFARNRWQAKKAEIVDAVVAEIKKLL